VLKRDDLSHMSFPHRLLYKCPPLRQSIRRITIYVYKAPLEAVVWISLDSANLKLGPVRFEIAYTFLYHKDQGTLLTITFTPEQLASMPASAPDTSISTARAKISTIEETVGPSGSASVNNILLLRLPQHQVNIPPFTLIWSPAVNR